MLLVLQLRKLEPSLPILCFSLPTLRLTVEEGEESGEKEEGRMGGEGEGRGDVVL